MRKLKIIVSYDGTDFHGWQIQPVAVTVVSALEKTFLRVFGERISLVGASRTDAGVHALGQAAHFSTTLRLGCELIRKAWNGGLPPSIVIRKMDEVSAGFHACFDVTQKTYYYHLFTRQPLPFIARFGWFYGFIHRVDFEKFQAGLQLFIGEHDFTAFCKLEGDKSPIRKIDAITVRRYNKWGVVQVEIRGKSFLRYQIRRMIGYTLDVARRPELSVDYLEDVLKSRDSQQTLLQADAQGLCLRKIVYGNDDIKRIL